jgi:hypothetical protein
MKFISLILCLFVSAGTIAQEHDHPVPEKLGSVSFPTSCSPAVQQKFERAVALLHSFAYSASEEAFRDVAAADQKCAMAHWGIAMSFYHQLWEPWITRDNLALGTEELVEAMRLDATRRERQYIAALVVYYNEYQHVAPQERAKSYSDAMSRAASDNPTDSEAQVFYALSLLATASLTDKTHPNQKKAADILEPLYKKYPQHPGIAHYLIHSYDSTELAARGLPAAREYAKIAPSAPHALHMPSHIFTRLGLWDDSIASNLAARTAAHQHGDIGEELHAMDYLTYAYLQRGRDAEARKVIEDLRSQSELHAGDFKIGYAATAMPVRYAIERRDWNAAAKIQPMPDSAPHVAAIAHWARAIGLARSGQAEAATPELRNLQDCLDKLKAANNSYWSTQGHVQLLEAQAWIADAAGRRDEAAHLLESAAAEEDSMEKLPVTPGPIVPAREQLGDLLLQLNRPSDALQQFEVALKDAPRRRGALEGAAKASDLLGDKMKAKEYRASLQ